MLNLRPNICYQLVFLFQRFSDLYQVQHLRNKYKFNLLNLSWYLTAISFYIFIWLTWEILCISYLWWASFFYSPNTCMVSWWMGGLIKRMEFIWEFHSVLKPQWKFGEQAEERLCFVIVCSCSDWILYSEFFFLSA